MTTNTFLNIFNSQTMQTQQSPTIFGVAEKDVIELFRPSANPDGRMKFILMLVGFLLTPISLWGSITWYKRGYERFMGPLKQFPRLYELPPIMRFAMVAGAIIAWFLVFIIFKTVFIAVSLLIGPDMSANPVYFIAYLFVNVVLTLGTLLVFSIWRNRESKVLIESKRHGTAEKARTDQLEPYREPKGIYVGDGIYYGKQGHAISVAGTRAGKGVNQLLPNLLLRYLFPGSIVCFDPKGENAAVAGRILEEQGKKVVLLNSWDVLGMGNTPFNCLDILKHDRINLSDDVQLIAECLVPADPNVKDKHFDDKARTYIAGLILHLVTNEKKEDQHLGTIWQWLRLDEKEWALLLADMMQNEDKNVGEIVKATATEIVGLMKTSDREFGSVMSTAQRNTDFIKSPALRDSLVSSPDFHPDDMANGDIALFLIIPADRLKSQSAYMRLVITSLLRSAVRNQGKDVLFLVDEAYAMGYHSEIELALGMYAGFGIHLWTFWQSLVQLKDLYPKTWENFIACCSVRSFFNISDNFSAEYLSKMFGQTSVLEYNDNGAIRGASARSLITPDELRRESSDVMYTVIDQLPVAELRKLPYYEMGLDCDPNPYYKP